VDPTPSDYAARQKPLEQFRANTKHLKIHPQERALLWLVGGHLCLLPWAIGDTRPWAQFPSFALAVITFVFALVPRNYSEDQTGSNRFRLIMWPKLVRFPIFWLGLALLIYVILQGGNPAWEYKTDAAGKLWWMQRIKNIAWLPAGVKVPFALWGPWRMLLIYSTVWLMVCAIWVGFTRRRTLQLLFLAISANGVLLAGFGIAERLAPNGKMFWVWTPPSYSFFSTFIYKNHAANFLDLTLFVTCGLAAWYQLRGLRRMEKSNPSGVLAFFATAIAVAILISYARGATVVTLVFLCLGVAAFVMLQLRAGAENRKPIVAVALILIFGYFLKVGFEALNSREAWTRLKDGITNEDNSLGRRKITTQASLEMLRDYWKTGAGAGSFRFLFPIYQARHPEIAVRQYWEHAHNDIVETPVELGVPGLLFLVGCGGYLLLSLVRNYFWRNPLSSAVVVGLGLLGASAWWDFPFQNPAILMLSCALFVMATMWSAMEESRART
jgi:O-antigen ligase